MKRGAYLMVSAAFFAGSSGNPAVVPTVTTVPVVAAATPISTPLDPLSIAAMRTVAYPGSDLLVEQTLAPGVNYDRYIASYRSDGYKIFGLLTIPRRVRPATGWPVIIFNHGYIPPRQYRTTERYVAYQDAFARAGYITFKSDYRGHGNSEGEPVGGYTAPDYTVDVLNALASVKRYPGADPNRIGMWGHSMGGQLTLRALVIRQDIKAAVIWAGVVAPYPDLIRWHPPVEPGNPAAGRYSFGRTYEDYGGTPGDNPNFWNSISPNSYVADIAAPIQLDHAQGDPEVPAAFSETLAHELQAAGKVVELYTYPGDNHNLSLHFGLAMARSVAFFDRYLK